MTYLNPILTLENLHNDVHCIDRFMRYVIALHVYEPGPEHESVGRDYMASLASALKKSLKVYNQAPFFHFFHFVYSFQIVHFVQFIPFISFIAFISFILFSLFFLFRLLTTAKNEIK